MTTIDTLIIGAGMAGLMAGTTLAQAGQAVQLIDKGRGVGGRMATRRLGDGFGVADHGAQYFTARSAEFKAAVNGWVEQGLLRQWSDGFYSSDGQPHFNRDPRYIGTQGMTTVARHMAAKLNVCTGSRVAKVEHDGTWQITTDQGQTKRAKSLILTPPVPQSLAILNVTLPIDAEMALARISYDPCFAVLATLAAPSKLPAPGGLWPAGGEPISWLADNQQKGISEKPTVTIHASVAFSRQHFESDRDEVARLLLDAAADWLGADVIAYQVQRWKYSIPASRHDARCLGVTSPGPLAFAGDAFAGPRVEGAALSGLAAADWILAHEG